MNKIEILAVIGIIGFLALLLGLVTYSNIDEIYKNTSIFILVFSIAGFTTLLIDLVVEIFKK